MNVNLKLEPLEPGGNRSLRGDTTDYGDEAVASKATTAGSELAGGANVVKTEAPFGSASSISPAVEGGQNGRSDSGGGSPFSQAGGPFSSTVSAETVIGWTDEASHVGRGGVAENELLAVSGC